MGAVLCVAGILLLTLRPKANPLAGRLVMAAGALVLVVVFWHIVSQPTFRYDR